MGRDGRSKSLLCLGANAGKAGQIVVRVGGLLEYVAIGRRGLGRTVELGLDLGETDGRVAHRRKHLGQLGIERGYRPAFRHVLMSCRTRFVTSSTCPV